MIHRLEAADFAEPRASGAGDATLRLPLDLFDPLEQIATADRADWMLLRLVLCAGAATLLLALASSL
jgi:hypothetical protein